MIYCLFMITSFFNYRDKETIINYFLKEKYLKKYITKKLI